MTQSDSNIDTLSAIGRRILRTDERNAYRKLVVSPFDISPNADLLRDLSPHDLLEGKIVNENDAALVLAGLWLRFDALEPAHTISQAIETPEGSLWHAILHRREGDFSNSKYWYRRVGELPLDRTIAARVGDIVHPFPADKSVFKLIANGWNPPAFVDLVERVHNQADDPRHALCVAIQIVEWQVVFEHCRRSATNA